MFERNDKRRLYWLMDMYLCGKIEADTFCDEFYYAYNLEIEDKDLSSLEQKCFSALDSVASRFSEFESDHRNYPGVYFTEAQLKQKILETKEQLRSRSEGYSAGSACY